MDSRALESHARSGFCQARRAAIACIRIVSRPLPSMVAKRDAQWISRLELFQMHEFGSTKLARYTPYAIL